MNERDSVPRGFRLKIPISSIKDVKAAGGALRLKTADGLAIFELSDKAEKWRDKILNPKSLVEKLGVKQLAKNLQGDAALWIVYPKGQKAITEADVRAAGLKTGLVDVKVAAFSATLTALKFVIPKSRR